MKAVECADSALKLKVERFLAEGEPVHDEHMPGLHLMLGENYRDRTGATWTARGWLALTTAESDVDLDGAPLIRRGRYVRFV